ncbi:HipA domain-containing protein [Helicobacter felis]|uniref:transcriptional regulator n=1 Tax=Helicobacter felis TaxID=214 RepID=UPI000CEDF815|nr:transcriptional regulator [Helicobacter felis]
MRYILKNKDRQVALFVVNENQKTPVITEIEVYYPDLLPIPLKGIHECYLPKRLLSWLIQRRIPKSRRFMRQILFSSDIAENEPLSYLQDSFALSLNDTFWTIPSHLSYTWEQINLYHNPFNEPLAVVAITGVSAKLKKSEKRPSPELTTNGMLKKCWVRSDDKIIRLRKGQVGTESYCEYYSAQIAKAMGLKCVEYDLSEYRKNIVCQCPIFTSEEVGFVAMENCIDYARYKKLEYEPQARLGLLAQVTGREFIEDLLFFDALVFNTDRHLGNFGMLIDNNANYLTTPAPIFDNGLAFLGQIDEGDLNDIPALFARVNSGFEMSFHAQLELAAQPRHVPMLERLKGFKFTRHKTYNLPETWLKAGESMLEQRAQESIRLIEAKYPKKQEIKGRVK